MACRTSIERRVWAVAVALGLCVVAPAVEAQQVVKLAAGVPLTGPLAKQGQEVADAVKLAAEEWNKKGGVLGRKIEVLEADDQGNPQVGVAAAEKVAADAAVLGAVWGITSVTCIPVSEVLDRVNLVLISPGCTNPKVTDRGLKNTNRVCARDDAQGPAGAIFAVQDLKAKKIAGAVLDVYRQEPLPTEHPFWTTPGIIVLPHLGGPHPQRDRFVARLFVENLGRFLDGKPLKEGVDRKAGY